MTFSASASAFAGFRFLRGVISVAVRWYLRCGLSYRDIEELSPRDRGRSRTPGHGSLGQRWRALGSRAGATVSDHAIATGTLIS